MVVAVHRRHIRMNEYTGLQENLSLRRGVCGGMWQCSPRTGST